MQDTRPIQTDLMIKPLTDEEVQRGLQVLEEARALREAILAHRGGEPLPSSAPLIRSWRAIRSRQI